MHEVMLKPGASEAEFEQFVEEKMYPSWEVPGTAIQVLKGDRGERAGKYLFVVEFNSVALRDKLISD